MRGGWRGQNQQQQRWRWPQRESNRAGRYWSERAVELLAPDGRPRGVVGPSVLPAPGCGCWCPDAAVIMPTAVDSLTPVVLPATAFDVLRPRRTDTTSTTEFPSTAHACIDDFRCRAVSTLWSISGADYKDEIRCNTIWAGNSSTSGLSVSSFATITSTVHADAVCTNDGRVRSLI